MPTITDLLNDHKDKELGNASTKLNQAFTYSLEDKKEYDLRSDTKIKLGGEAGADVLLLNESNKTDGALDTERIFDLPRKEDDDTFEFLSFKPIIPFGGNAAWLRYRLFAKASATANTSISPIGISLDAKAAASASYYKKHSLTNQNGDDVTIGDVLLAGIPNVDSISNAIELAEEAGDKLLNLPTIFERNAVLNAMNVGDAFSFRVAGGLDLGVEVNLTDLLSGAVAGAGVFTGLLSVKYSAGVSFTASASVTDEFILIIAKSKNNRFEVAYRKSESRSLGGGASVGAKVNIDDSNLQKLADEAIASVAEVATAAFSKLDKDIDSAIKSGKDNVIQYLLNLTPESRNALDNLLPKLVDAPFDKVSEIIHQSGALVLNEIEELKRVIDSSKEKLFSSLKTEGKSALELSVGLEYSRVSADRDILRFDCDGIVLKKIHKDLYCMDLKSTRAAIEKAEKRNSNQIKLTNYLREQSLTKQRTFSIGFTLLAWSFKNARTTKVRRNILQDLSVQSSAPTPILKVAYETTRSVTQESNRLGETYAVSFGAQSFTNARHPDGPTTDELDYTIGAAATYKAARLSSPKGLIEYLDTGMIYGALGNIDLNGAARKLYNDLKANMAPRTKITINTGVSVKGELTRSVLRKIAQKDHQLIAKACARAMTWMDIFAVRKNMNSREDSYAPIFLEYFNRDRSNGAIRELLYKGLIECGEDIAKFEKYYASGNQSTRGYMKSSAHMDYFLGVVTKYRRRSPKDGKLTNSSSNDVLRDGVNNMGEAAQSLIESWRASSSFRIIENRIHKKLLDLWENEFNGRFFGAYINLIALSLEKKHSAEFETIFRVNFTNTEKKDDHIDLVTAS